MYSGIFRVDDFSCRAESLPVEKCPCRSFLCNPPFFRYARPRESTSFCVVWVEHVRYVCTSNHSRCIVRDTRRVTPRMAPLDRRGGGPQLAGHDPVDGQQHRRRHRHHPGLVLQPHGDDVARLPLPVPVPVPVAVAVLVERIIPSVGGGHPAPAAGPRGRRPGRAVRRGGHRLGAPGPGALRRHAGGVPAARGRGAPAPAAPAVQSGPRPLAAAQPRGPGERPRPAAGHRPPAGSQRTVHGHRVGGGRGRRRRDRDGQPGERGGACPRRCRRRHGRRRAVAGPLPAVPGGAAPPPDGVDGVPGVAAERLPPGPAAHRGRRRRPAAVHPRRRAVPAARRHPPRRGPEQRGQPAGGGHRQPAAAVGRHPGRGRRRAVVRQLLPPAVHAHPRPHGRQPELRGGGRPRPAGHPGGRHRADRPTTRQRPPSGFFPVFRAGARSLSSPSLSRGGA